MRGFTPDGTAVDWADRNETEGASRLFPRGAQKNVSGHSSLIGNVDTRIFCEKPADSRRSWTWSSPLLQQHILGADREGIMNTIINFQNLEEFIHVPSHRHRASVSWLSCHLQCWK
jgi:hypothetical protein